MLVAGTEKGNKKSIASRELVTVTFVVVLNIWGNFKCVA
jgi:hypothetical protein